MRSKRLTAGADRGFFGTVMSDDDRRSYFSAKHNDYLIVYFCVALDSLSWFRRFEPWRQTPKIKQA
jgi:hypothetical protein